MEKKLFIPEYNARFHYHIQGNGPQVMLIHGLFENSRIWKAIAESLSDHYTVLIPDLPGHGLSEDLEDGDYALERIQAVLFGMADAEQFTRFPVIGHSMGGYAALAMAEASPGRISRIAMVHSTAKADTEEKKRNRERSISILNANRKLFFGEVFKNLFHPGRVDEFSAQISQLLSDSDRMSSSAVTGTLKSLRDRKDRMDFLLRTRQPVSYFIGKHDHVLPADDLEAEARLLGAHYVISATSGHMGFYESPDELLDFIRHFLEKEE
jgi:pimeloyl-ACP methyl ester carboxylesterase